MDSRIPSSDDDLLASGDSEAFGIFYDRHVRMLLGYFARRTGDPEVAADLTAETFACAIAAQDRYRTSGAPALAWLFTIASRRLVDFQRRGAAEQRTRRSLALQRPALSGEDAAMIALLAEDAVGVLLAELPAEQRDAVAAHIVGDRGYAELADSMHTSQAVVRQRVSRGLSTLRRHMGGRA